MSSELHQLFRREIDRIPLRPEAEWVPQDRSRSVTRGTPRHPRMRLAVRTALVLLLVVVSTAAGLLLGELRRDLATNVASPSADRPAFIAGRDLVHLAIGEQGSRGLLTVEMPEGRVVARNSGETYVGDGFTGSPLVTGRDLAFLPVITSRPGEVEVSLRGVDLRTGAQTTVIDVGSRPFAAAQQEEPYRAAYGATPSVEALPADGGSSVLVVRDTGTAGRVTLLERYDARTGDRLAERQWAAPEGVVRARLAPIDETHVAVVRNVFVGPSGSYVPNEQWHFVDAELNEISTVTVDAGTGVCEQVLPIPLTREWLMVCFDPSGSAGSRLIFLDASFRETARLDLDRRFGSANDATVMEDGTIAAVTGERVVRIDPRTHSLIDRRLIVDRRASLLDLLSPSTALAKGFRGPATPFSRDGNFAYVSWSSPGCAGCVSLVDLRSAAIVAQSTHSGQVLLSDDGGRVYVLTGSGPSSRLVLLDPGTLREVAETEPLSSAPFSLIAVAPR